MACLSNNNLKTFRFWCQKVLPLVYDDSLSYYEVLCKVVDYLNIIIANNGTMAEEIEKIEAMLDELQNIIDNFGTDYAEKIIREYLATMIFVEIPAGRFVYYIPESWEDITFETTGYDVEISGYDYGHLVLSY